MNDIMKTVLSLSLSGSLLILVLLLARTLFRHKISKGWQYYLWLIVIARLLLPITPETSLMGTMFMQLGQNADSESQTAGEANLDNGGTARTDSTRNLNNGGTARAVSSNPTDSQENASIDPTSRDTGQPDSPASFVPFLETAANLLWQNLWLIWMGTALLLLVRKVTAYQSFVKYAKAGCREVSDIAALDVLAETMERLGVNKPVELYENRMISTPMLLGFFRPCILLPSAGLPERDLRHIFLHELIHCKRLDLFYKWLIQLTLCLHWFNPLVWLMEREISRACELACDEAVLGRLDEKERISYGDTLMHALEESSFSSAAPASVTLGKNAKFLKERLGAILRFQPKAPWGICASLLLAAALTAGFLLSGAYSKTPSQTVGQPGRAPEELSVNSSLTNIPADNGSLSPEDSGSAVQANPGGSAAPNQYGNPAQNQPGRTYVYNYRQQAFYQDHYLFVLGWNLLDRDRKSHGSLELSLPDGTVREILLDSSCADFSPDTAAAESLAEILAQLTADTADTEPPLTLPVLISFRDTGDSTPAELAEQAYQEERLLDFAGFYPLLEEQAQSDFLDRACNEGKVSFFSVCLDSFQPDGALMGQYAGKAYEDKNPALFSVCLEHLPPDSAAFSQYAGKAYEDREPIFFSLCMNYLGEDSDFVSRYLEKAYEDDEVMFFSIGLNNLKGDGGEFLEAMAARAIRDKKTHFLSILSAASADTDR